MPVLASKEACMARPLRIEYEGAFYHVTSRGNDRKKIFFSPTDYKKFLSYLSDAVHKYGVILHAFILMGNTTILSWKPRRPVSVSLCTPLTAPIPPISISKGNGQAICSREDIDRSSLRKTVTFSIYRDTSI